MERRVRAVFAAGLAVVLLAGGTLYAAGGGVKKSIEVVMNGVNLVVDGRSILEENILYQGTTYIPIRAVAASLNKDVNWDAKTSTVEIGDSSSVVEKDGLKIYTKAIKYKNAYSEVDLKIPVIEGLQDTALMDRINGTFEKKALDLKNEAEKLNRENIEEAKKQGWPIRTGSVVTQYETNLNNNGTLSISVTYYEYTGGAHGNYYRETMNLDLKNEKQLSLETLFPDSETYKKVVTAEILKQMAQEKDDLFPETLTAFKATEDLNFFMTEDALVFYFNPYEIAPYARGIAEYKIPYDALKDILSKSYAERL